MNEEWTRKDKDAIRRSVLLGRLPSAAMRAVLDGGSPQLIAKGEIVCRQGDAARTCYVILGGTIKLSRVLAPRASAIISIHKPSQSIMEGDALNADVYSTTAEAVTEARLARVDALRLRDLIAADPPVALAMLASASMHLRMLLGQVERLKTMTATTRLADFILSLIEPGARAATVSLPYEKRVLAAQLGITPESFSRTLRQLRSYGVIVANDQVEITDVARLRQLRFRNE